MLLFPIAIVNIYLQPLLCNTISLHFKVIFGGSWVVHLVNCQTLDISTGHDLRGVSLSSGQVLHWAWSLFRILSLPHPLPLPCPQKN